jgi:hypothetical protein
MPDSLRRVRLKDDDETDIVGLVERLRGCQGALPRTDAAIQVRDDTHSCQLPSRGGVRQAGVTLSGSSLK